MKALNAFQCILFLILPPQADLCQDSPVNLTLVRSIFSLFLLKQDLHPWWLKDTCPPYHSGLCALQTVITWKQAFVLNHVSYPVRPVEESGCPENRPVASWHIYGKPSWVRKRSPCLDTEGGPAWALFAGVEPSSLVCFTINKKENYLHWPLESVSSSNSVIWYSEHNMYSDTSANKNWVWFFHKE